MELADAIRRRRMVRNYDPDRPVPPEVVDRLLGYAVHAPSAGFSQGWEFLLLDDADSRAKFWAVTTATSVPGEMDNWLTGMTRAPVLVVAHSHRDAYLDRYAEEDKGWTDRDEARWPVPYWHIYTGMASLLILLGAVDEGLGACFFGIQPEHIPGYREAFGVPDAYMPIGVISIGYRDEDRRSPSLKRGRREATTVTHRGRWGG